MLKVIFEDYKINKVMQDDVEIKNVMSVGYENDLGSNVVIQLSLPSDEVRFIYETNRKKPKFNAENYICGVYAMHCDTKEKAEIFCSRCGSKNHTNAWDWFGKDTCYILYSHRIMSKRSQKIDPNVTILEFDDFDWEE